MSHTKKPENTITLKKAELRKDEEDAGKKKEKMRKDEEEMTHYHKHQWQVKELNKGVESTVELSVGREVLRAGLLTSLKASFTVSHQGEYLVFFFWVCVFVCRGGFLAFCAIGFPLF